MGPKRAITYNGKNRNPESFFFGLINDVRIYDFAVKP
jgi:hypothetical protein